MSNFANEIPSRLAMMENDKNIIFHVPLKLDRQHASASQIRPLKMMEAFKKIGYHVDVIEGDGKNRKTQIRQIKHKILQGTHYDFMYSESSTMPTLLTEKHHLPLYPLLDFNFFHFCQKHNIPIGLFYRDIHWCFINKNKDWKQRIAKFFYQYDLTQYQKVVDILFLPSAEMLPHIPFHFENKKIIPLPPGCEIQENQYTSVTDSLNLLYVGGIGGNYDLTLLLQAVSRCPYTHLTIGCRKDDWLKVADTYAPLLTDNISIEHKQPLELADLYGQAHLFALFFQNDYWKFAAPLKLFETIGYKIPLLAAGNTWAGQFIKDEKIGYTIDYNLDTLIEKLQYLQQNHDELRQIHRNLCAIASLNTWECRAQKVADELTTIQTK